MRDRIRRAFDAIHAEEQLKTDIKTYIARKTREYPLQKGHYTAVGRHLLHA